MKILSFPRVCSAMRLLREHANVHPVALPDQFIERAALQSRQAFTLAVADVELGDASRSSEVQQGVRRIVAPQDVDLGAGGAGNGESRIQRGLIFSGNI